MNNNLPEDTKVKAFYPTFTDPAAEIIWLQGQLAKTMRDLAFQTERLQLRADSWEANLELSNLHAHESLRLRDQVNELEKENAKLRGACARPTGEMPPYCFCQCQECARGTHCRSMACGVPAAPKASPRNAAIPAGPEEKATPNNTGPAITAANPNAGVKKAFPGGRW